MLGVLSAFSAEKLAAIPYLDIHGGCWRRGYGDRIDGAKELEKAQTPTPNAPAGTHSRQGMIAVIIEA